MGFVLPSGVVNTDSAYFYAGDLASPLGPHVKQLGDQTLIIIDYTNLTHPITLASYKFTVDVTSNPQLVVAYPQLNTAGNVLSFLLSGGIAGQQYNLSILITFGPSGASVRADILTISIPSSSGDCTQINPVPAIYNQVPLIGGGYVNSAVRYFWGPVAPTNPNVADQWFNIGSGVLYEWVTDGTQYFWDIISSPNYIVDAPNDGQLYSRYANGWTPTPIQSDAPSPLAMYVRQHGAWTVMPAAIGDPPHDGQLYGRQGDAWALAYSASNPAGYLNASQITATLSSYMPLSGGSFSGNVNFSVSATFATPANLSIGGGAAGNQLVTNGAGVLSWNAPPGYVLPTASTTVLGGVKIDGTTINISAGGVISAAAAAVIISATVPVSPAVGSLWFDSVGGQLYLYYSDGNSSQWVPAVNQAGAGISGALPPSNVVAPVVSPSGSVSVGQALSCSTGTWTQFPSYTYQWLRDSIAISGATTSAYTVQSGDSSHSISCSVTGTNGAGSASATSNSVSVAVSAPVNSVAPVISGTGAIGQTLTVTNNGTWSGSPTFTYQWLRDGVNISGAIAPTYVLVTADGSHSVSCAVTATNVGGSSPATSNAIAVIAAPVNSVGPSVSGGTHVGQTLTVANGTWSGSPTFTYSWLRDGTAISPPQTASTYLLASPDATHSVSCLVTATNVGGSASQGSNAIAVTVAPPINSVAPVVSGTATVGSTLTVTNSGTWSGSPTFTYQWLRDAVNISGATATTYVVVSADQGHSNSCAVTGTNPGGSAVAGSNSIAIPAAFTYPAGAFGLYSLRKIPGTSTTKCLTVFRGSDSTSLDINFASGLVDMAAIAAFTGPNQPGYCIKLYDQSGNGNDLSMPSGQNVPQINLINGQPWLCFTLGQGNANVLASTASPGLTGDRTIGFVGQLMTDVVNMPISQYNGGGGWFMSFNGNGSSGAIGDATGQIEWFPLGGTTIGPDGGHYLAKTNRYVVEVSGGISSLYANGVQTVTGGTGGSSANTAGFAIGGFVSGGYGFSGLMSEAYVYTSGLSPANRNAIDANLASFWNNTGFSTPYSGTHAVEFDVNETIVCGNVVDYERTASWTAWCAVQMFYRPSFACVLYSNAANGTSTVKCHEYWIDTTGKVRVRIISDYTNVHYIDVVGSTNVVDGKKHMIVYSYNGSSLASGVQIYIDGVLETMTTNNDTLNATIIEAGQSLYIGNQNPGTTVTYMMGTISHFQIDNVVRSPSYIANYTPTSGTPIPPIDANTDICLLLNDGSGTTATDATSHARNGTLTHASMWIP